jgi:LysM repeat protein
MQLRKPLIPVLCLIALSLVAQNRLKPYEDYIAKYANIAVLQQKKHGVPASITLAQGILESGAGNSVMAKRSNNHFGIKCHNTWTGDTVMFFDDGMNSCFRKYDRVEQSFDDHSLFLANGKRYAALFQLDVTDYKSWAYGLKSAGYATDPSYPEKLIRIIETYDLNAYAKGGRAAIADADTGKAVTAEVKKAERISEKARKRAEKKQLAADKAAEKFRLSEERRLQQHVQDSLDKAQKQQTKAQRKADRKTRRAERDSIARTYSIFSNEALENVKDYQAITVRPQAQHINPLSCHEVFYCGTTPYVTAQFGDSFNGLSDEFGISPQRLIRINEFPANHALRTGEPVYLDTKTTWWEGEKPYHLVKAGESMHFIAQKYALKLDALYKMNDMNAGDVPKVGSRLKLRNPDQMSTFVRALNYGFNKTDSTTVQPDSLPLPTKTNK